MKTSKVRSTELWPRQASVSLCGREGGREEGREGGGEGRRKKSVRNVVCLSRPTLPPSLPLFLPSLSSFKTYGKKSQRCQRVLHSTMTGVVLSSLPFFMIT